MIEHLDIAPERVVVVGAGGFIGGAVAGRLERDGIPVLRVARRDVDLLAAGAEEALAALLRPEDTVVAAAAIAPCKTPEMLQDNVRLTTVLARALNRAGVAHVVNIGSDAVFADTPVPLTESSPKAPGSYHGVMHLAREIILESEVGAPLATLRPTLVYGAGDPHGGYGPNQFRRRANRGEGIVLFGEGEERRDHVFIDDVAELAARVVLHRSRGSLNIASGAVASFRDVAELAVRLSGRAVAVTGTPRRGPMPHNGYRPFDIAAVADAFPGFRPTALAEGMARAQRQEFPDG